MSYDMSPPRSRSSHSRHSSTKSVSSRNESVSRSRSRSRSRVRRIIPTYHVGSPGPVNYKLNVNYKLRLLDEIIPQSAYVNDRPFDIPSLDVPEDKKQDVSGKDSDVDQAFDVVTDVFMPDSETRLPALEDSVSLTSDEMVQKVGLLNLVKVCRTRIVIKSQPLRKALSDMIGFCGGEPWTSNPADPAVIFEPYDVLMHHYHDIEAYQNRTMDQDCDDESAKQAVRDMSLLFDFFKSRYLGEVRPAEESLAGDEPTITFDMLWLIFRPGTDVWVQGEGDVFMAVVHKVRHEQDHSQRRWSNAKAPAMILELWCLGTDGNRVAREVLVHVFERFTGSVKVTSLSVCPCLYWDKTDKGVRRQHILDRSRLQVEAMRQGSLHVYYHDHNNPNSLIQGKMVVDYLRPRPGDLFQMGWVIPRFDQLIDGDPALECYDYIFLNDPELSKAKEGETANKAVDSVTHLPYRREIREHKPTTSDSDRGTVFYRSVASDRPRPRRVNAQKKALLGTTQITEHQLLLLPNRVPAFALNTKRWHLVNTAYIRKVEPSEDSIKNLVIEEQVLKTIRALSSRRDRESAKTNWSADFIEGKGVGQIILLHGPPGVGKTYTVEAVAEWLKRPFLALTVANLGTIETSIEQQLITWFDLAEAWNAVLLVDEADIFLEQRKNRDLSRNGLVTAFLRRMEYFKGLLFLTTNRVGQIDDAFISRVHVAIEYKALTKDYRQRIWKGFFAKLHAERRGKIKISPRAQTYVMDKDIQLNGREIRNALQTAIALAEFEARQQGDFEEEEGGGGAGGLVTVEEGHFKDVLDMCEKFHLYVASIRREDEKKRASGRGDRNDYGD